MRKLRLLSLITVLTLLATMILVPVASAKSEHKVLKNIPVAGRLSDGGTFTGKLSITHLDYDTTQGLLVSGVLRGQATTLHGKRHQVNQTFTRVPAKLTSSGGAAMGITAGTANTADAAVAPQAVSCGILNLILGPLHLNLLGLTVDLNQVILNIAAVPGAGNLLGNLLCAVANLLNPGGSILNTLIGNLTQLLNLLNLINGLL